MLKEKFSVFLLLGVILVFGISGAHAAPTLTCGGQVTSAPDRTSADGGTWKVYNPNDALVAAAGTTGTYRSGYWAGEVGLRLEDLSAVGENLICVLHKEVNAGTADHRGYFAVSAKTLSNNEPAALPSATLSAIPVPSVDVTLEGAIDLSWQDTGVAQVTGYDLYKSEDGITYTRINGDPITDTSYTITSPEASTKYYALGLVYSGSPVVSGSVISANSIEIVDSDDDSLLDGQEDADGDGVVDSGETDPNNADTDGDGMSDGWETDYGFDPLTDDASEDADGDGFTNLEEYYSGTDPNNSGSLPSPPDAPTLVSPADTATDVGFMPELVTEGFSDPDGDIHQKTRWQIAEDEYFDDTSLVYDEISETCLNNVIVPPNLILEPDTVYYWRAMFRDRASWSDPPLSANRFTTKASGPTYPEGIRDGCQLTDGDTVKLGSDFETADGSPVNTDTQKVLLSTTQSDVQVGLQTAGAVIAKCGSMDPASFADQVGTIPELPLGVFEIALDLANEGNTAEVSFHFSEPVDTQNFIWWMYDPNQGGVTIMPDLSGLTRSVSVKTAPL